MMFESLQLIAAQGAKDFTVLFNQTVQANGPHE
jgi:hypothetical protein